MEGLLPLYRDFKKLKEDRITIFWHITSFRVSASNIHDGLQTSKEFFIFMIIPKITACNFYKLNVI